MGLVAAVALFALATLPVMAQAPAAQKAAAATAAKATVPALFLSDIHLDPFHDPAKVAELNAAAVGRWPAILARPDSATQAKDYAALQAVCPVRGLDTSYALWESSLKAMKRDAAQVKFATVSGDLMAHAFDCKYKTLVPAGTHADYLAFVEKTIRTIVSGLREAVPGVPVYVGLGNNDSGCGDYALDASGDAFLAEIAPIVDGALGAEGRAGRAVILNDFKAGGYYSAALPAAVPNTRILVLDDIYSSGKYKTCAKVEDPASASAQLDWLTVQLNAARAKGEKVWVLGHIPPGVDLYTTAKNGPNLCEAGKADMFLGSEKLAEVLAAYPDTVRLALFGHTHSDEMRLLLPEVGAPSVAGAKVGVPLKVTASITAVNGNNPTFTLAQIDPATATLADYTVVMASNQTGIETTWAPEYTYSAAYGEADFSAASLTDLIGKFRADATGSGPASQIYLRSYFPGDKGTHAMVLQLVWPMYACAMDHDSAKAFAACVCAKPATP